MYNASCRKHELHFIKPARTSRNVLQTHTVYYIILKRLTDGKVTYGEAAPLKGLSVDDVPDFYEKAAHYCRQINEGVKFAELDLYRYPSLQFAFETAFLAMKNEAEFVVFDNGFVSGTSIAINGLVWMDDSETMLREAFQKVERGFSVIKFKVGALDFDEECRMLEMFRKRYSAFRVDVRLDANGAFRNDEALEQLKELSRFDVHSIEQPVKAGQLEMMQMICAASPIRVALDEELIGIDVERDGEELLKQIRPAFIILKPTLLGGFSMSDAWIKLAVKNNTGWWTTSALESNVGLNAIAQWTAGMESDLAHGLGTGELYSNNIPAPLSVSEGSLHYNKRVKWDITALHEQF